MKLFIKLLCFSIIFCFSASRINALVQEKVTDQAHGLFSYSTFFDYPPFGYLNANNKLVTIYRPFLKAFSGKRGLPIKQSVPSSYDNAILQVVSGETNLLLGVYFSTERYRGIQLLYPSIVNNPIVPVTLPSSDINIQTKEDLKNLKGAIDKREHFSDYVARELQKLNVQEFDNSEKLYEQLFIGNVDYILTSRYYGALEQAKLGLRDMVQMSKTAIWDMPLFIGVSDAITNNAHKRLVKRIQKLLKEQGEELKESINQLLIEKIRQADEAARGVVPPSFVK